MSDTICAYQKSNWCKAPTRPEDVDLSGICKACRDFEAMVDLLDAQESAREVHRRTY